jgi:hypothetical protein
MPAILTVALIVCYVLPDSAISTRISPLLAALDEIDNPVLTR